MSDPYVYPGTNVLKNKFKLKDQEELNKLERLHASTCIFEIKEKGIQGNFDFTHLQKIHQYIFKDIYDWSGKCRTVEISKGTAFCPSRNIDAFQSDIFSKLKKENHLKDLDLNKFSERAAYYLGELNILHPFREGNGRAQREFMRELAKNAGYELTFDSISKDQMIEASVASANCDYSLLTNIIKETIKPLSIEQTPEIQKRLQEIKNAADLSKQKRCVPTKELYDMYAKDALQKSQGEWKPGLDKEIVIAMKKAGIEDLKLTTAIGHSPALLGLSSIDKNIKSRTLIREVTKGHPELQKGRGMSL
ncbi:MAG: fic [Firmicutes bacterium]|nr:fic [Bacillota bacterium]